jgi:hypothetical protein
MTPRVSGPRPYQRKNSVAAAIALVAMLIPGLVSAQGEGIVRADSAAPRGTAASDSAARDSVRRDSVSRDSLPGDSVVGDSARRAAPAESPPPPADSLLGAACGQSGGASPDLVLVKFRLTATAAERAAVAGAVGGTVQGPSDHAPGSWYLSVPGSAGDRSVADRLIQMSPVLEVGVTRCSP